MLEILSFYQNLPQKINPVAWRLGEVEIYWYSLAWVLAVLTAWGIAFWRIKKAEAPAEFDGDFLEKVVLWGLVGALLGGRLGYVLLYRPDFFLSDPWSIVSPFDSNGRWIGLRGMSFFGGLAGLAASLSLLARQSRIGFWKITDFIAPAAAAGYFWGRVGNFLGGELYGSPTDKPWGMYFDGQLRHPSQIYEATLEGAVLFWLLWKIRNKDPGSGFVSATFLLGYGAARFFLEFYRWEDEGLFFDFGRLTHGQVFALLIIFCALAVYRRRYLGKT